MDGINSTHVEARAGDEVLVYDPPTGAVHVLNATAALVRDLAAAGATPGEIGTALRREFATPDGCDLDADVAACLRELRRQNLLGRPSPAEGEKAGHPIPPAR